MDYTESNDYAGYDPYDALNSPLIGPLGRRIKWFGIGCTQFIKRCPVNIRPLLLIPRQHNPKAIGLFLWGYAKLYKAQGEQRWLDR
ncbi:MAG TPA: delta-aminolevulinic acid dehydratase, partial [Phycisphaerales bacterium]|nr:delta-aminolevulinic acid dehydratase [Phycisphaerales bacterium]